VAGADGSGGLRWPELMVVAVFMHMGGSLTHVSFRLISLDPVHGGEMQ
jgi:hypothetical protein